MKKSTIYLNKHNYKDIKIVLLIFKSSDKIITRIKANDWIKYSTEIGAYMVRYSERNIGLLKDIFRDIAEVNTYYLERKRINPKAIEINIGNNFGKYSKLKLKRDLHNVRLFPFKIGNISYLQLQYKKNYKINRELELSSVCRWSKDLSTFILPAKKASILRLLKELDKLARIQIHSSLKISDAKIMQQLYEQSYIKNPTYIACPVEYISFMLSRNYSINTIRTYHNLLLRFLNSFKANTINQINNFNTNTINRYFQLLNQSENCNHTTLNQSINAIKLYYIAVVEKSFDLEDIVRPKKVRKDPDIFSIEEVQRIILAINNLKHKAIIMMLYSAGLRISEVINLKLNDINSDRMIINVRAGKGKKDRISLLSQKALNMLRKYFKKYKPREYLFEGQNGGRYSATSIRKFLEKAKIKAKVYKAGSAHALRHSYATHLLENGTDLRYIQALLGHNSSKTTEIYARVSTAYIEKITSPGDLLDI